MMYKLICFDLDGVLVDAVEWHYQALNEALYETSGLIIQRSDHETIFNGLPTKKKLEILSDQGKIDSKYFKDIEKLKQEKTLKIISKNLTVDFEKILLHQNLLNLGFKIACVTNSIYETAKLMLQLSGQFEYIDYFIHNQSVRYPKPHAEPYIKAMIIASSFPEETLIVEDSENGLKAAASSGADIWKVNNPSDVTWENFKNKYL